MDKARKFKGDLANPRPRAILTPEQFEVLLHATREQLDRSNMTGLQKCWLYLVASQSALRAQELSALTPTNFHLTKSPPYIEIPNRISKRGKKSGISAAILTGQPTRIVMKIGRLSSEKLLDRYVKISEAQITACVNDIPVPKFRPNE